MCSNDVMKILSMKSRDNKKGFSHPEEFQNFMFNGVEKLCSKVISTRIQFFKSLQLKGALDKIFLMLS